MMRHWVWAGFFGLYCVGLAACVPSDTLSITGSAQAPREANCDFAVLTVPPASGYFEIGALDFTQAFSGKLYTEVNELKSGIHDEVCKAGGDAVIAFANGYGEYMKVTILKRAANAAAVPVTAPPVALPPPPTGGAPAVAAPTGAPAKPAADPGCHYDAQCKGDRICTDGKCVPPTPPSAPSAVAAPSASASAVAAPPASKH